MKKGESKKIYSKAAMKRAYKKYLKDPNGTFEVIPNRGIDPGSDCELVLIAKDKNDKLIAQVSFCKLLE